MRNADKYVRAHHEVQQWIPREQRHEHFRASVGNIRRGQPNVKLRYVRLQGYLAADAENVYVVGAERLGGVSQEEEGGERDPTRVRVIHVVLVFVHRHERDPPPVKRSDGEGDDAGLVHRARASGARLSISSPRRTWDACKRTTCRRSTRIDPVPNETATHARV